MITVVLVIHLLIAIAMCAVILLQRSEGGALGIGGGGGGVMSGRSAGNLLTRTTGILATGFFATSMILAILANSGAPSGSLVDDPALAVPPVTQPQAPAGPVVPER